MKTPKNKIRVLWRTKSMDSYSYFIGTDLKNYIGQWVVIVDESVVGHGKDVKKIYNDAKTNHPGKRPLIAKVPDEKALIF